jgi:NADPH2:quinone reductase
VRALLIERLAEPPRLGEREEPRAGGDERVLDVVAAPLNPVDISIARGGFFAGQPPLPYVPGVEAVGRAADGALYFTCLDGLGVSRDGALAERLVAREDALVPVPLSLDPALAAALGTAGLAAWFPLTRRTQVRPDDVVLVLAATGAVGSVAVQAAKLLGAERVVAVGRSAERLAVARELGADATVVLAGQQDLADEFVRACGGRPPTLVFDPLWGPPAVAAINSAARFARVIQLGQGSSPEAMVPSAAIRGKALDILGYTSVLVPFSQLADAYRELAAHAAAGRIHMDIERATLDDAVHAWRHQAEGGAGKLVVCP